MGTYGTNRPIEMDHRIFTARRACVLHTIQRKENSWHIQIKMVIMPEEIRNRYCACISGWYKGPTSRTWIMLTGGEERVERQIATTMTFASVYTITMAERASSPWKKRWLRAVFLASML